MLFSFAFWLLKIITTVFLPMKVIGKENVPDGRLIVCGNHSCSFDPVYLVIGVGYRNYSIMAKSELFQNKFIGFILRKLNAFPVDRGKADVKAIKTTLKALKEDRTLVIFPEGTRIKNKEEEMKTAKTGVGMFALKTNTPVLPVYIHPNTKIFHRTTLIIGEPILFEPGTEYESAANQVIGKIRELKEERFENDQNR